MNNKDYWEQRFTQFETAQNQIGASVLKDVERQYRTAEKQIESEMAIWYQRFADNNRITLAEARRWLTKSELKELQWDVRDYIRHGEENAITGQWMKELENASAKYHICRLDALKIQLREAIEELYGKQEKTVSRGLRDAYTSGYYHTAFELQKGCHVGFDIAGVDQRTLEKILAKPWVTDGYNFSQRIWNNKDKLIQTINKEVTQNIILGTDPQKAINNIAEKMETSKHNAGRLVMTEEAYFSSLSQGDCFRDLDVEKYQILATLDSHTSQICRGLDGKVFPMSDYKAGETAPPFHVYCRSTTIPYFEDDFGQIGQRAAKDEEGKTYYVPANMTYKEWKKKFVDGGSKLVGNDEFDNLRIDAKDILKQMQGVSDKQKDALQQQLDLIFASANVGTEIEKRLFLSNMERLPVNTLETELTEQQIIDKLSGGDLTKGSCASLSLAYAGCKAGLDVTDFRGGESCEFFSLVHNLLQIMGLHGVKGAVAKHTNDFKAVTKLLIQVEEGKEYILTTGEHAAIIRKTEKCFEWLELQSGIPEENRFTRLTNKVLKDRFKCQKSHTTYGYKLKMTSQLIDCESLGKNPIFRKVLAYLNTEESKQLKGGTGDVL